jgi:V8-like Glu-specific endopeptidase
VHPLVVHGVPSTSDEDAVVLMLRTADDGTVFRCGATMIAPNLALTARHCVSSSDEKVNCDIAGNPTFGGKIEGD